MGFDPLIELPVHLIVCKNIAKQSVIRVYDSSYFFSFFEKEAVPHGFVSLLFFVLFLGT